MASPLRAVPPRGPVASAGCRESERNTARSMHSTAMRSLAEVRRERPSARVRTPHSPRLLLDTDAHDVFASFSSGVPTNAQPVAKTKQGGNFVSACRISSFLSLCHPSVCQSMQPAIFRGSRTHVELYIFQIFLHPDILIGYIITSQW